jgi:hypothetical protein
MATITIQTIEKALESRLSQSLFPSGDSDAASVLVNAPGGHSILPTGETLPLVTFTASMEQGVDVEGFRHDAKRVTVTVTVHVSRQAGGGGASLALARVHGESDPSDSEPGDFGLELWEPQISGMKATPMRFVSATTEHQEEVLVYVQEFETVLTRK